MKYYNKVYDKCYMKDELMHSYEQITRSQIVKQYIILQSTSVPEIAVGF